MVLITSIYLSISRGFLKGESLCFSRQAASLSTLSRRNNAQVGSFKPGKPYLLAAYRQRIRSFDRLPIADEPIRGFLTDWQINLLTNYIMRHSRKDGAREILLKVFRALNYKYFVSPQEKQRVAADQRLLFSSMRARGRRDWNFAKRPKLVKPKKKISSFERLSYKKLDARALVIWRKLVACFRNWRWARLKMLEKKLAIIADSTNYPVLKAEWSLLFQSKPEIATALVLRDSWTSIYQKALQQRQSIALKAKTAYYTRIGYNVTGKNLTSSYSSEKIERDHQGWLDHWKFLLESDPIVSHFEKRFLLIQRVLAQMSVHFKAIKNSRYVAKLEARKVKRALLLEEKALAERKAEAIRRAAESVRARRLDLAFVRITGALSQAQPFADPKPLVPKLKILEKQPDSKKEVCSQPRTVRVGTWSFKDSVLYQKKSIIRKSAIPKKGAVVKKKKAIVSKREKEKMKSLHLSNQEGRVQRSMKRFSALRRSKLPELRALIRRRLRFMSNKETVLTFLASKPYLLRAIRFRPRADSFAVRKFEYLRRCQLQARYLRQRGLQTSKWAIQKNKDSWNGRPSLSRNRRFGKYSLSIRKRKFLHCYCRWLRSSWGQRLSRQIKSTQKRRVYSFLPASHSWLKLSRRFWSRTRRIRHFYLPWYKRARFQTRYKNSRLKALEVISSFATDRKLVDLEEELMKRRQEARRSVSGPLARFRFLFAKMARPMTLRRNLLRGNRYFEVVHPTRAGAHYSAALTRLSQEIRAIKNRPLVGRVYEVLDRFLRGNHPNIFIGRNSVRQAKSRTWLSRRRKPRFVCPWMTEKTRGSVRVDF